MQRRNQIEAIKTYLQNLPDTPVNKYVKEKSSIYLSGSAGYGIEEGFDEKADWDLHIILEDEVYAKIHKKGNADPLINDPNNKPTVFGQIRSKSWLKKRLDSLLKGDCTYLWIYTNGLMIDDKLSIHSAIKGYSSLFQKNLNDLIRYHYIRFAVARFSTAAASRRGISTATSLYNAEMIELALQTICLLHGQPYAYTKWLEKQVSMIDGISPTLLQLIEASLASKSFEDFDKNARNLRLFTEETLTEHMGKLPWIKEWWNYNQNPPDLELSA